MIRGRTGWDKTVRVVEGAPGAPAVAAVAGSTPTPAGRATTMVAEPSAHADDPGVEVTAAVLPAMKRDRKRLRAPLPADAAA